MHRIPFKNYQRDELLALGITSKAIECIEIDALPFARRFLVERPPPKNDVLNELRDLQKTLTDSRSAIERLLNATSSVPQLKEAQALLNAGQEGIALGRLDLNATSRSLSTAVELIATAIAQVPPGPLRHRLADPYPIEVIFNSVQEGSLFESGDPMSHGLWPSASPTSGFRRMIGLCYEAINAKNVDPERALRAYVQKWNALVRHHESLGISTERPRKI